ncbi:MAG TPA: phytanoyl-CoA dioxygenase family protein [Ohtaekwangia sp.]
MQYKVNDRLMQYEATGEKVWGENDVLLHHAVDLTAETTWATSGFTIEKFLDHNTFQRFAEATKVLLLNLWKEAGLSVPNNFLPEQYHTLIADYKNHLQAIEKTKQLSVRDFPIPIGQIEERISSICRIPLVARNPFDDQSIFHFRIIRPGQGDNNPLHRDVWLEDYDNCINLYIPVAGSTPQSSLILIPGSHHWPESRVQRTRSGAIINGIKFNVPAVTAISGDYQIQRPSPDENNLLIFSPYLIHGGAVNLHSDITRISIELRLWKK